MDSAVEQAIDTLRKLMEAHLVDAHEHMNPDELTSEQRFAIAFAAGVPYETTMVDGEMQIKTEACSVFLVDGRWHVVY